MRSMLSVDMKVQMAAAGCRGGSHMASVQPIRKLQPPGARTGMTYGLTGQNVSRSGQHQRAMEQAHEAYDNTLDGTCDPLRTQRLLCSGSAGRPSTRSPGIHGGQLLQHDGHARTAQAPRSQCTAAYAAHSVECCKRCSTLCRGVCWRCCRRCRHGVLGTWKYFY
jgi:hypothetical protein